MASTSQQATGNIDPATNMARQQVKKQGLKLGNLESDPSDFDHYDDDDGENTKQQGNTTNKPIPNKKHHHTPKSLPSTIKVKKSTESQVTSSMPGLSSLMDMSMTEISEENQIVMVKTSVKNHVFSIWKFYQPDFDAPFSEDENTLCGFIMKKSNLRGNQNWWLGMRRIVVKTLTDLRNNAIKNMQMKFKGNNEIQFSEALLLTCKHIH